MHVMPASRPQSAVAAGAKVHTDRYPSTFGFEASGFGSRVTTASTLKASESPSSA